MSAYKVISVVGTSTKSWEDATQTAVSAAAKSLRDLRIAKVVDMDVTVDKKGKITQYRCRVDLSFKYEI
jgi:dodecin